MARRRRRAPCAGGAGSARRCRLRRDIGAERRAPASELSSTPSMVARHGRRAPASDLSSTQSLAARHRRGAPCAGQRDLSGLSSTPSMTARRRRRAPCAGGGEAQLDAVDCGATSARSAVRRRAGSARRSRWRRDISAKRREPASGLSSTPSIAARRSRGACAGRGGGGSCVRVNSTPSIAARRRRGAPCAGQRAQLDSVDGGAASARSAVCRRAGSARRR